jgi:HEAT repeat protein
MNDKSCKGIVPRVREKRRRIGFENITKFWKDALKEMASVEKILMLGEKGKTDKLLKMSANKKVEIRAAAAEALGKTKAEKAIFRLQELIRDPEIQVQIAAAKGLGEMGNKLGVEYLRKQMADTTNDEMKEACRVAIAKIAAQLH